MSITWIITPQFEEQELVQLLSSKFQLPEESPPNDYILQRWKGENITIHRYEKKLLVQLNRTELTLDIARSIAEIQGLDLDTKNATKFASLLPKAQNAILCEECKKPSILIVGRLEQLDLQLKNECGHVNRFRPPILMLGNRILPDMNIIVGNNLSMCLNLGYFKGFEVVLPKFLIDAIDDYLGPNKKKGASKELENLLKLEEQGLISILYVETSKRFEGPEEFGKEEDDFILDQAKLTNSILITSDDNLKRKAILSKRPVILLPQKIVSNLKHLEGIRGFEK